MTERDNRESASRTERPDHAEKYDEKRFAAELWAFDYVQKRFQMTATQAKFSTEGKRHRELLMEGWERGRQDR